MVRGTIIRLIVNNSTLPGLFLFFLLFLLFWLPGLVLFTGATIVAKDLQQFDLFFMQIDDVIKFLLKQVRIGEELLIAGICFNIL